MQLPWWANPWTATIEARREAERLLTIVRAYREANSILLHDLSVTIEERDEALTRLARRSAGISRGNRTRALRRHGGLLPATDFTMADRTAA